MKKVLIPREMIPYKANLHCHTSDSDGRLTPEEVKEMYKSHGYSILAITDHEIMLDNTRLNDEDFLILTGYEVAINAGEPPYKDWLDLKTCHLNLYAKEEDNREMVCFDLSHIYCPNTKKHIPKLRYKSEFSKKDGSVEGINRLIKIANENGFFVSLNHPTFSLQTTEDYGNYEGLWGMEIYNNNTVVTGAIEYETAAYNYMLKKGKKLFCTATDDNHREKSPEEDVLSDNCGGYCMVYSKDLKYNSVIDALLKGDFYASTGAEIKELYIEDDEVHVVCGKCRSIRIDTGRRHQKVVKARKGEFVTELSFKLYKDDIYFMIEIENLDGKRAFTNPYYTEDLF